MEKSNAEGSEKVISIEDGFSILTIQNETDENQKVVRDVEANCIQFHFCIKGNASFIFNEGRYILPIEDEKSLLLYNPQKELPLNLVVAPKSWLVSFLVSINKFHSLFSEEASYIDFLKEDNSDKKYYQDGTITPSMAVVLTQILNFNLNPSVKRIYLKGKAYELMGLYFNRPNEVDVEQCPFLIDEDNVRKIRNAKEIIIHQIAEPPSLQELADAIGLSLKKLKEGFKEIYGDTVFGFLFDYKMEYARKLLETGSHNVNEVGLKVGYSTSSHFISAFKKKFGITPKKYLMTLRSAN
ncbi:MAG: AraC family transcriptional regulator [Flavobacteriaceae bacterium CG_4_8_14_3_um_filter_34_10]|nr:helix-turn-helix transcriptional regulator [Flavobacteriia bacterium]OIP51569.1 MAG: AraC family transcriptional regulator [Flavobacteriaceae bacterium CG2_30_34_30]PIQ18300.1 MAG: AraC family transcriptional regulator [Flavobacteriaceae bacterium CG18_big_fil_WC_8_21_14_2_50_34_36]PIX09562.1 MAG: AraC family transcriptional regulator [Flavobacteriaceae bacterium CG_4_8_14_3_um_filter_34_10]PIZ07653.1 MAG: AraC family transcriptional regulator [Flavobacteriaceae bacterium CG_4_10_14_0_8_um_f